MQLTLIRAHALVKRRRSGSPVLVQLPESLEEIGSARERSEGYLLHAEAYLKASEVAGWGINRRLGARSGRLPGEE
jgi:hypothetical protein